MVYLKDEDAKVLADIIYSNNYDGKYVIIIDNIITDIESNNIKKENFNTVMNIINNSSIPGKYIKNISNIILEITKGTSFEEEEIKNEE